MGNCSNCNQPVTGIAVKRKVCENCGFSGCSLCNPTSLCKKCGLNKMKEF